MSQQDPFAALKAVQRDGWSLFGPLAAFTTSAAASLVAFAEIPPGSRVLDVACGTGVVAITAALAGAEVSGLDLSPALIATARCNAMLCPDVSLDFVEGDAEALPYPDRHFDVVLSQFGHMFTPRPAVVLSEMLRVLKPGGTVAFSTWPPELLFGRLFEFLDELVPPLPGTVPSTQWGEVSVIRERLGAAVRDVEFHRDEMWIPALSVAHYRNMMEQTAAPFFKLVQKLAAHSEQLAAARGQMDQIIKPYFFRNQVRQAFLMTRARYADQIGNE